MENAPAIKEETNLTSLAGPESALAYAQRCSKALMDVVRQCDLAKNFGGKKDHIEYEGWGMIAEFYGCSIGAEEAIPIGDSDSDGTYKGYRAKGYVKRNDDGAILATADSSCSRDEKNWKNKPDYQLMSMAQTRAGSKAARMKFSWIAALAGFSATPAEEMVGEFESRKPKTSQQDDLPDFEPPKQTREQNPLTDAQNKKLFAMTKSKELGKEEEESFRAFLKDKAEMIERDGKQFMTKKSASDVIEKFEDHFIEWQDSQPPWGEE